MVLSGIEVGFNPSWKPSAKAISLSIGFSRTTGNSSSRTLGRRLVFRCLQCLEGHEPSRAGRSWVCFSQPSRSNYTHPQKEQGFLSTVTILHIFGTDLKRHVHIHFIVSSGGLKLSGKAERLTKYVKRKATNRRTREKRVIVLVDEPSWVR